MLHCRIGMAVVKLIVPPLLSYGRDHVGASRLNTIECEA